MIKKALLGKYNKTAADIKIRKRACERGTIDVSLRTPKPDTMRLATLILSLLMTVTAAAQRPDTTYTLEADNLLNRPYFDHGNIPQPGLWLRLGLQYDL